MTVTCPNCKMENAYLENEVYVCPDCGHEWPDDSDVEEEINDDDDKD